MGLVKHPNHCLTQGLVGGLAFRKIGWLTRKMPTWATPLSLVCPCLGLVHLKGSGAHSALVYFLRSGRCWKWGPPFGAEIHPLVLDNYWGVPRQIKDASWCRCSTNGGSRYLSPSIWRHTSPAGSSPHHQRAWRHLYLLNPLLLSQNLSPKHELHSITIVANTY